MNNCPQCGDQNPNEARFCQSCGTPLAAADSTVPKETRKTVSVVFCDLKGSTSLGESIDPETLRRVIARYFNDMKAVLERHGGTVEKFIGDAVMAAFGVPILHEDDALRAVRAAEEMQVAMAAMNDDIELEFGVTLAARIGVNTGEVIAGDASAGHGFVSGDAINVAARLEAAAAPGEIFVGEPTYRLVRDAVKVEAVEPLTLKGKAEPMPAYRLLEVIPHVLGSSRRLDSPLVARDQELARLNKTFEEAIATSSCRVLTILGNAGAGKSRLTADFIKAAAEKARVISGRCLPYGDGITFWPIAEAIKALCSITEEGSSEQATEKIAALMPEGEEGRLVADRIAGAIGLTGSTPDTQETFWAIRKLFEHLGSEQPLLLVFDDIHWAEPTMLDLIEYLGNFMQGVAAMLLCVSRGELLDARPSWGAGGETLALEPLGDEAVAALISNLLGSSQLPEVTMRKIIVAAEGNPLYVEEILRMLIDDGLLRQAEGHWTPAGDLSDISIPPTISALLTARLDRLNTNEQGVIQRGSVVGREFWWGAVTELSPDSLKPHVGGHLQMLVRKELIRPHASTFAGEDAFRFSNIMIRDAAYQGMPKELRGEWHEQFAGWLQEKAGDRDREYEEILGYHLEQAYRLREDLGMVDDRVKELGVQAAAKLGSAGSRAFLRADMPAAENLLSRATALLPPKDPTRLELSLDLADALKELGEVRRAGTVLDQIERAATAIPDERLEARARLQHLILRSSTGEGDWETDATKLAPELMEVFGKHGDELGLARAHLLLAEVHWDNMDHAGTDAELEEALTHARLGGREHEEARILSWLSSSQFWGPTHVDVAIARCEEILRESKGNRIVEARTMLRIAGLQAMRGRYEQARILIATSRAVNADLGQASSLATSVQEAGLVEMLAGDPSAAEKEFRAGYERSMAMGENAFAATAAAMLSEALYAQKRFDEALEFTMTSEKLGADRSEWAPTRAKVLARRGELEEAVQMARDAVVEASETDDLRLRGDTFMALAEVLFVAAMRDDARTFVEKALALYEGKGIASSIQRANTLLGALAT